MEMMTIDRFYKEFTEGKRPCDVDSSMKWIKSYRQDWMTYDQWLLSLFLCRPFRGFHHCPEIKQSNCGVNNISINTRTSYFSNYDYDYLTKMVIMAHNWGVRVSISGSAPGMFKITLWKKHYRKGDICERMPTIQDMIEQYKDF